MVAIAPLTSSRFDARRIFIMRSYTWAVWRYIPFLYVAFRSCYELVMCERIPYGPPSQVAGPSAFTTRRLDVECCSGQKLCCRFVFDLLVFSICCAFRPKCNSQYALSRRNLRNVPSLSETGTVRVYDASDFTVVADILLAADGEVPLINDIILSKTAAYITDSIQQQIYKVRC